MIATGASENQIIARSGRSVLGIYPDSINECAGGWSREREEGVAQITRDTACLETSLAAWTSRVFALRRSRARLATQKDTSQWGNALNGKLFYQGAMQVTPKGPCRPWTNRNSCFLAHDAGKVFVPPRIQGASI